MKKARRTRLVHTHLPLVRHLANRMARQAEPYLEVDDLIAIGVEALLRAAERYDPARGVAFGTFAYLRVRGAMVEGLGVVGPLSRGVARKRRDRPTRRKLPVLFRLDEERLGLAAIGGNLEEEMQAALDAAWLAPRLTSALDALGDRDRRLIERHYFRGDTLEDIGRAMGRSRSWASRVHARVLSLLREAIDPGAPEAPAASPARLPPPRVTAGIQEFAVAWRSRAGGRESRGRRVVSTANAALRAA
jgi:RNA polymerase sigma factor FliA